ncbi:MAG: enoyl-CoA hydratase-related protein [Pseudomonadota bacterium]
MPFNAISYGLEDKVATIRFNRPDSLNALDAEMRREVMEAVLEAREEARVLVITGTGRGFCAGQDLGDLSAPEKVNLERLLTEEYHPVLKSIADCPIPVISAVNGIAAGAGANLALAADMVIAKRSAVFLQAFARIGLMPDAGGTYWLPRLVGPARAMGMSLLADPIPADMAAEWGLIWEVIDDDLFEDRTRELARRLADGPTLAFKAMKQAIRASSTNDFADQLALEARLQSELGRSRDFMEGVLAFLSKRKADFEGR